MKPLLPAFAGLRAFEAAARHMSFTKAANELNVTPAAVSQLVRHLEQQIGNKLFVRSTRSLKLTERGRAALPLLGEAVDRLYEAAALLRDSARRDTITVSVTPSFGARWLLPRLPHFHASHPDISVRIDARDELVDLVRDEVDMAIRQGGGVYRGLDTELLIADVVLAVCAPAMSEEAETDGSAHILHEKTLLHVDWQIAAEAAPSWTRWMIHHGIEGTDLSRGLRFTNEDLAVRAAVSGMGIALVTSAFVTDDIAAGRLVRWLPASYDMPSAFQHYLVFPKSTSRRPKSVEHFRQWLLHQASVEGSA